MDFNKLAGLASSAYEKYQDKDKHEGQSSSAAGGGGGGGGGFDISSMASSFLSSNNHSSSGGGGGFDMGDAARMASQFLGDSHSSSEGHSSNNDMFSSALKMAMGNNGLSHGESSHDEIKAKHDEVESGGGLAEQGQKALGMAAAYKAYQQFQGGGSSSSSSGGGGGGSNELVGLAMKEAKKLFDSHQQQGGQANQTETLATAAQAAMKLFMK